MGKHLIDIDEQALAAAQAALGTVTMKDTVNRALAQAAAGRTERLQSVLDDLAMIAFEDRDRAWR